LIIIFGKPESSLLSGSVKNWRHPLIAVLQDMVAFSCCVYDGGDEEKKEMDVAREIGWKGKFTKRGRVIRPGVIRMNGKCPLTPLEVCLYQILDCSLMILKL
jgi:hypothetical protein